MHGHRAMVIFYMHVMTELKNMTVFQLHAGRNVSISAAAGSNLPQSI